MNFLRFSALAALPLFIFTACSIIPEPEAIQVNYYDIGFPVKTYSGLPSIKINTFSGTLGNETKMLFRTAPNKISIDIYNQWSQAPSNLLQRYFILAFTDNGAAAPEYILNGKILRMEGDLEKMQADIVVRVTVQRSSDSTVVLNTVLQASAPFKTKSASAFAEAMGTAVAEITQQLADKIKPLKIKK